MAEYKLEPCPCGGEAQMVELSPENWRVWCAGSCLAQGPYCPTEVEATHAWNRLALAGEMERLIRDAHSLICAGTLGFIFGKAPVDGAEEKVNAWVDRSNALLARLAPGKEGE